MNIIAVRMMLYAEVMHEVARVLRNAYMTDLMNHFAHMGELYFNPIKRGWFEVDDPKDLRVAEQSMNESNN